MYEVEVKVRADHDAVESALTERGATRLGSVTQTDTYFDAPHRDFAARDEALRLREEHAEEEAQYVLTYKGPLVEVESKTREEFETEVGSEAAVTDILEALGFSPAATVQKTRRRFELDGFTVSLDDVEGLGEFVEIEAEAGAQDLEQTREAAIKVLEGLGLDAEDQIRTSYLGLLLEND